jgi:hypothetical protein
LERATDSTVGKVQATVAGTVDTDRSCELEGTGVEAGCDTGAGRAAQHFEQSLQHGLGEHFAAAASIKGVCAGSISCIPASNRLPAMASTVFMSLIH